MFFLVSNYVSFVIVLQLRCSKTIKHFKEFLSPLLMNFEQDRQNRQDLSLIWRTELPREGPNSRQEKEVQTEVKNRISRKSGIWEGLRKTSTDRIKGQSR